MFVVCHGGPYEGRCVEVPFGNLVNGQEFMVMDAGIHTTLVEDIAPPHLKALPVHTYYLVIQGTSQPVAVYKHPQHGFGFVV